MPAWDGTGRGLAHIIEKCRHLEPSQPSGLSYRVRGSSIFMNGHASEKLTKIVSKSVHLGASGDTNAPQIPPGKVLRCTLKMCCFSTHL